MTEINSAFRMGKEEGRPNVVINIQTAYNVNPAATKVENTFIIGSRAEARKAMAEATGGKGCVDPKVIRPEILKYVSRVLPLLHEEAKGYFMRLWDDILNLPEVETKVYNPGNQMGTIFNRDLVANILYHLRIHRIYKVVYRDDYNGAALCEALEGDRDHSVKHALRDEPPFDVREAVDRLLKEKY